jgi:hypothetical protein
LGSDPPDIAARFGKVDRCGAPTYYPCVADRTDQPSNERRSNLELREVIDSMLERIRDFRRLTNVWSAEERARAEQELEALMARLRETAIRSE